MPNRLAQETSPYLRQHADNPVDWRPWNDETLALARKERKPILLSIGYSACHWCHVMAHESFEHAGTARVMNKLFVNIKVDREERPDLDKIFQSAHQALTGRGGGWPLTMFLDPESHLPFFAGTYFPREPRHGMPAFAQVLERVREWFDTQRGEIEAQNARLANFLNERDEATVQTLDTAPIAHALDQLAASFDHDNGGRQGAPKFPHAGELELLLATSAPDERSSATTMLRTTLDAMAERGLRDHLGGGFFRYCVDATWSIPHFEKMLYDNAQLLPLYAIAARRFGERRYEAIVRGVCDWLDREMTAPGGAFYGSLDADSEGEEGKFYIWTREELRATLDEAELDAARVAFGLGQPPNFERHAWHLQRRGEAGTATDDTAVTNAATSRAGESANDAAAQTLERAREKLLAVRNQRVRPGLDDKILTAWNALAIAGLARSARALADDGLAARAERALDFVRAELWRDGRLFASYAGGSAKFSAYLDDYAFLLDAVIELLQCRWRTSDLLWAMELADALLDRFEDREGGGFFFTASDAERLPQRPKPFADDSLPAGNAVAARALSRLGHLIGEPRYLDAADRTVRATGTLLERAPYACCAMLLALREQLDPPLHVVVRASDADASRWASALAMLDGRGVACYRIPPQLDLPGVLGAQAVVDGGVAYACRGTTCGPPIADPSELATK